MNILERLVDIAPGEIRLDYPQKDTCILSTAIAIDVLKALGIACRPLSVEAIIGNRPFGERVLSEGFSFKANDPWWQSSGAYSIGFGFSQEALPGKTIGHLVSLSENHILDLTLDQADRPTKGIHTNPSLISIGDERRFLEGEAIACWHQDTFLFYRAKPLDRFYESAPDWTRLSKRRAIVERILRKLS